MNPAAFVVAVSVDATAGPCTAGSSLKWPVQNLHGLTHLVQFDYAVSFFVPVHLPVDLCLEQRLGLLLVGWVCIGVCGATALGM
jgi:hypothetical protein